MYTVIHWCRNSECDEKISIDYDVLPTYKNMIDEESIDRNFNMKGWHTVTAYMHSGGNNWFCPRCLKKLKESKNQEPIKTSRLNFPQESLLIIYNKQEDQFYIDKKVFKFSDSFMESVRKWCECVAEENKK